MCASQNCANIRTKAFGMSNASPKLWQAVRFMLTTLEQYTGCHSDMKNCCYKHFAPSSQQQQSSQARERER